MWLARLVPGFAALAPTYFLGGLSYELRRNNFNNNNNNNNFYFEYVGFLTFCFMLRLRLCCRLVAFFWCSIGRVFAVFSLLRGLPCGAILHPLERAALLLLIPLAFTRIHLPFLPRDHANPMEQNKVKKVHFNSLLTVLCCKLM